MTFDDLAGFSCSELMPQARLLVLELQPPLLQLNLLTYQLRVIQQLTPHHWFVHSGFDSKS